MSPPIDAAMKDAMTSRVHDYMTIEATLLVGVLVVFYLTVIILLFGSNMSCTRLFSGHDGAATHHHQSCHHLHTNHQQKRFLANETDCQSACGNNHQEFRNERGECSNSHSIDDDGFMDDHGWRYQVLHSNEEGGNCKQRDAYDPFDDTDGEEEDSDEAKTSLVIDKKGQYTLSYSKKEFNDMSHSNSSNEGFSRHSEHCNIEVSRHCLNKKDEVNIRQQKLNFIEQQLKAHSAGTSSPSEVDQLENELKVCRCMQTLPYSQSVLLSHSATNKQTFHSSRSESALTEFYHHQLQQERTYESFLLGDKLPILSIENKSNDKVTQTDNQGMISSRCPANCAICLNSTNSKHNQTYGSVCQVANCSYNSLNRHLNQFNSSGCFLCEVSSVHCQTLANRNSIVSSSGMPIKSSLSAQRLANQSLVASPIENFHKLSSDCSICLQMTNCSQGFVDDHRLSDCSSKSTTTTCPSIDDKLMDFDSEDDDESENLQIVDVQVKDVDLSDLKFGGIGLSRPKDNSKQDLHVVLVGGNKGNVSTEALSKLKCNYTKTDTYGTEQMSVV